MKPSELQGAALLQGVALDWAVWSALGLPATYLDHNGHAANFSTQWAQGGPIIEREGISIDLWGNDKWVANYCEAEQFGPTPLVAAMRSYVASKLGDEVNIPEELK